MSDESDRTVAMLKRVEIRRIDGRWHASAGAWSTSLGNVTVEEILMLFRSSTIVFLPNE